MDGQIRSCLKVRAIGKFSTFQKSKVLESGNALMNHLLITLKDYKIQPLDSIDKTIESRTEAVIEYGRLLHHASNILCNETLKQQISVLDTDLQGLTKEDSMYTFPISGHSNDAELQKITLRIDEIMKFWEGQ